MLRRLADTTLRTYAHELLHFLRWWESVHHTDAVAKDALTESTLLDYVRFQSGQERELTGATINQRVAIVDRALRIVFPDAPRQIAPGFQTDLLAASTHGHRQTTARLEPVAREDSQTNHRASVGGRGGAILVQLSHLTGLGHRGIDAAAGTPLARSPGSESRRSAAVRKRRSACAARATRPASCRWLRKRLNCWITICGWSGPQTSTNALFVSLKGPARGARMTPAGLRSLFRHHRRTTGVKMANPHRFRHTFASDMVRAGVSLPALMQLDGACAHPDHDGLCAGHSPRGLSAICASRRAAHQARTGERDHETLPLRSAGTSIGSPVPASRRVPHCRPQSETQPVNTVARRATS